MANTGFEFLKFVILLSSNEECGGPRVSVSGEKVSRHRIPKQQNEHGLEVIEEREKQWRQVFGMSQDIDTYLCSIVCDIAHDVTECCSPEGSLSYLALTIVWWTLPKA